MISFPWAYDTFKAQFLNVTGVPCEVVAHKNWSDLSGWTIKMKNGIYWAITSTNTPTATGHPHAPLSSSIPLTVRWGSAAVRVWRCTAPACFNTRGLSVRSFFPSAIVPTVARTTHTGVPLRVVDGGSL